jgi:hypothetical protein
MKWRHEQFTEWTNNNYSDDEYLGVDKLEINETNDNLKILKGIGMMINLKILTIKCVNKIKIPKEIKKLRN